jgi:hypothetical protein
MVERRGSDLSITAGFPPAIKIDGEVRPQAERSLTSEQAAVLTRAIILGDRQLREVRARRRNANSPVSPRGVRPVPGQRLRPAREIQAVLSERLLRRKFRTIDASRLPAILKDVVLAKRGLVRGVSGRWYRIGKINHPCRDGRSASRNAETRQGMSSPSKIQSNTFMRIETVWSRSARSESIQDRGMRR